MNPIRNLVFISSAILGLAVLAPPASLAAAFAPFTVDKECGPSTGFTGVIPSICNITASSVAALVGAKVTYYGPQINAQFVSSAIVLDAADGTASGYCMVYRTAVPLAGMCAFHAGTGSLAGFQAVVKVTFTGTGTGVNKFHWEGIESP